MSTLISIDFDFLMPHGMFEDEIYLPNVGDTFDGMLVYDWQMNERRSEVMDRILWDGRARNFRKWGLDIQELTKPTPKPANFIQEISALIGDWTTPTAWRGDSHAWGGVVARDFSKQHGPLSVVNFDAHHDLGYRDSYGINVDEILKSGNIQCDDWALVGLAKGWIKNYTVVYPDWLGKAEWGRYIKRPWLKEFRNRITVTTWSEYKQKHNEIPNVEAVLFCRSSSWCPPWLDPAFTELVDEWGYAECLDCLLGQHNSPFDTCKHREWDWKLFDEEYEAMENAFSLLKGKMQISS